MKSCAFRFFLLLALSLGACSPNGAVATTAPQPQATPTAFPTPATNLPPVLVDVQPPPNSMLPLDGDITLVFSTAMDVASVQNALSGLPNGTWNAVDDHTLRWQPAGPLPTEAPITLTLSNAARAKSGQPLAQSYQWRYQTPPLLQVTDVVPAAGSHQIPTDTAIMVTFNQPVVPLGTAPEDGPSALTLSPPVAGSGEWINTSTYVFYPQKGLAGGITYTAQINPSLRSALGAPLAENSAWSFDTALPQLESIAVSDYDETDNRIPLDPVFEITFTQPMDAASLEQNIALTAPDGTSAPLIFALDESGTHLTIRPGELLERATVYTLQIGSGCRSQAGTPLPTGQSRSYRTWGALGVPEPETSFSIYGNSIRFVFDTLLDEEQDTEDLITASQLPEEGCEASIYKNVLYYYCASLPRGTQVVFTFSPNLRDRWGATLGEPISYSIDVPPPERFFALPSGVVWYTDWLIVNPDKPTLQVQASQVEAFTLQLDTLDSEDIPFSYDGTVSAGVLASQSWEVPIAWNNGIGQQAITLSPEGRLTPGIYRIWIGTRPAAEVIFGQGTRVSQNLIASYVQGSLQVSAQNVLLRALDARTGQPVANAPVTLYRNWQVVASGKTDDAGIWYATFPQIHPSQQETFLALIGRPGEENFGIIGSDMIQGMKTYRSLQYPEAIVYLYSDRPIYKPGQVIHYRGIVRQAYDGFYSPAPFEQVTVALYPPGYDNPPLASETLTLNEFGAFDGQFTLPATAAPGYYTLRVQDAQGNTLRSLTVQAAHYVKPTFAIDFPDQPDFVTAESETLTGAARYYFGAPASGLTLTWDLAAEPLVQYQDGYRIGGVGACGWWWKASCSEYLDGGETRSTADGSFTIPLTKHPVAPIPSLLRVSVYGEDESGQPIGQKISLPWYPSETLIGVRSRSWGGQAGQPQTFDLKTWTNGLAPRGDIPLKITFSQVHWKYDLTRDTYAPVLTPFETADARSAGDGSAQVTFTPQHGGLYRITVEGDGSRSEMDFWVSGRGNWPPPDSISLQLKADAEAYQPGETARVYIPNPFDEEAQALIAVERHTIWRYETRTIPPDGLIYELPIEADFAPDIYLDVTLQAPGYRLAEEVMPLHVAPQAQTLTVALLDAPTNAQPGETVTLQLRVTDANGHPVESEFSLSVVDLAVLALTEEKAPTIVQAFYGKVPLGVLKGSNETAFSGRFDHFYYHGGRGGGGGENAGLTGLRSDFRDTAFWTPAIRTDADGHAEVTFTLPDNLTTWHLDLRGLTRDTRVGQAEADLTVNKPLMIQPVVPQFFVQRDHARIAAQVFNNTDRDLSQVRVSLQTLGFQADDPASLTQTIALPAHGSALVTWWGTVESGVSEVGLLFSAENSDLSDRTLPENGAIPVRRYVRPQTFVTAGTLTAAGSRKEVIALPPGSISDAGSLRVQAAPTLLGQLLQSFETLPAPDPRNDPLTYAARWFTRWQIGHTLQAAGGQAPDLSGETAAVFNRLAEWQRSDGCWSWSTTSERSSPDLTLRVLFLLAQAGQEGLELPQRTVQQARSCLEESYGTQLDSLEDVPTSKLDQLALVNYVYFWTGGVNNRFTDPLIAATDRLSPFGRALLALQIGQHAPNQDSQRLLEGLQGQAVRSASGTFWEKNDPNWGSETNLTTAAVTLTLAQLDPASPLLPDAVRYLVLRDDPSGRYSAWQTAWQALALSTASQALGDLAGRFTWQADLNGVTLLQGEAAGPDSWDGAFTELPLANLGTSGSGLLTFDRSAGSGTLYYRADLQIWQPVETVAPISRGMTISRQYFPADCRQDCQPVQLAQVSGNQVIRAQVTVTVPHTASGLQVEDFIPAGMQVVDDSLRPYRAIADAWRYPTAGWNWWYFDQPQIYSDHIAWQAEYLPPGTYTLTYLLIPTHVGEFRVLPARAWLNDFPDVQATSAGGLFTIVP